AIATEVNKDSSYHASVSATSPYSMTIVSASSPQKPFYSGFQITPDTAGTATVTGGGGTVKVTLADTPAVNEVWTLTVDGSTYPYTVKAVDTLATIGAAVAALPPTGTYSSVFNAAAKSITISRRDRRQVTGSIAVSTLGAAAS